MHITITILILTLRQILLFRFIEKLSLNTCPLNKQKKRYISVTMFFFFEELCVQMLTLTNKIEGKNYTTF